MSVLASRLRRLTKRLPATGAALALCIASASAVGQEAESEPPRLLKGGLVQQLRSLTQDAFQAKEANEASPGEQRRPMRRQFAGRTGAHRPATQRASNQRSNANTSPSNNPGSNSNQGQRSPAFEQPSRPGSQGQPQPPRQSQGFAAQLLERLAPAPANKRGQSDNGRSQLRSFGSENAGEPTPSNRESRQPRVASSESMKLSDPATRKPTRDNGLFGRVHVESELPEDIRFSLQQTAAYQEEYDDASRQPASESASTAAAEQDLGTAPKVRRVPLPSQRESEAAAAAPSSSEPTLAEQPQNDQRGSVASDAPQVSRTQVPSQLVATPSVDHRGERPAAILPRQQTTAPKTPEIEQTAETESEPPASQQISSPMPELPPSLPTPSSLPQAGLSMGEGSELSQAETTELDLGNSLSDRSPTSSLSDSTPIGSEGSSSIPSLPTASLPSPVAGVPQAQAEPKSNQGMTLQTPSQLPARLPASNSLPTNDRPDVLASQSFHKPSTGTKERLKMTTPRVQVVLNGPSDMPVGKPSNYEIVVLNDDQIDLEGLILRLDVPAGIRVQTQTPDRGQFDVEQARDGATLLTWAFNKLPAGNRAVAPIEMVASTARNFAVAMEWTLVPLSGEADLGVRAPRLEVALEGPSEVNYGELNTYRLHVRNLGDAPAAGVAVQLSADPFGASTSEIGQIAPGASETVDVELTFNEKGPINIAASAAAGDLISKTAIDVLVRKPEVQAAIRAPRVVYYGNIANYQVQLQNSGDAAATRLHASLQIPSGTRANSLPPGARIDGNRVTWPVGDLGAGQLAEFRISLNLGQEGENRVLFECQNQSSTNVNASAVTLVQAVADLKLLVSDPISPAPVGEEVVYELEVTNRGSKAAENVAVVAQFSTGIEPTRGIGHTYRVIPGQMIFEPIAKIAPGEVIKLQVYAVAETGGTHRFRSEVRAVSDDVRLVQEESTRFLGDDVRVATPPGGGALIR